TPRQEVRADLRQPRGSRARDGRREVAARERHRERGSPVGPSRRRWQFRRGDLLHFRLHEVTPVMYGGNLQFPITGGRGMLRSLGDIIAAAPDELYVDVAMGTAPENVRWLAFNVCYCGPSGEAERVVGPLRKLGKPL